MAKFGYKKLIWGMLSAGLVLQTEAVYAVDPPAAPALPPAAALDGVDNLPRASQDAGSLLNQQEQDLKNKQDQFATRQAEPEARLDVNIDKSENKENSIRLKGVTLVGDKDVVTPPYEKALTEALTRVPVTLPEIYAVLGALSNQLSQKGMLVRFELPEQDVTEGILQVYVVVAKVSLNDKGEPDIQVVRADSSKKRTSLAFIQKVATSNLRKAMLRSKGRLLISDLENMRKAVETVTNTSAQIALAPGEQAGSTRAVLVTNENRLFSGQAWLDRNGNKSTGKLQGGVQASLLNPVGYGDQMTLSVSGSEGLKIGRASYGFPIGYSGLRANLQYTYLDYELIDSLSKSLGISGTSKQGGVSFNYPLISESTKNWNLSTGYTWKRLRDEYEKVDLVTRDRQIQLGTFSIEGTVIDRLGKGGQMRYQLEQTFGDLSIEEQTFFDNNADDAKNYNTHGDFRKITGQVSRLQQLSNDLQLALNVNGQYGFKNLGSSEQFFLGGPYAVRAYPSSEGSGDIGYVSSLELIHNSAVSSGRVQLKTFADYGYIRLHKNNNPGIPIPTASQRNDYSLAGIGWSLMYTDQKRFSIVGTWAHTLGENAGRTSSGKNADGTTDKSRFWLQGVLAF